MGFHFLRKLSERAPILTQCKRRSIHKRRTEVGERDLKQGKAWLRRRPKRVPARSQLFSPNDCPPVFRKLSDCSFLRRNGAEKLPKDRFDLFPNCFNRMRSVAFQQLAAGTIYCRGRLVVATTPFAQAPIFSRQSRNPATVQRGLLRICAAVRAQRRFPDKSGIGRLRSMYLRLSRRMFVASCSLRPKTGRANGNYLRKQ